MLTSGNASDWFKQPTHSPRKTALVGVSCLVLLVIFGVVIAHSDDTCMANAQLGLNLTWWTGINCFAALLIVLLGAYVLTAVRIAWFVGIFFVPWHVIGFVLLATSQNSCITNVHGVGVAAGLIFLVDVAIVITSLILCLRVTVKRPNGIDGGSGGGGESSTKPPWMKMSTYMLLAVGLLSVAAIGIGSSYMSDSCLTPDPTGINLAQWIVTIGTVTFAYFAIVTLIGGVFHLTRFCNGRCCYLTEHDSAHNTNRVATVVTAMWSVFLIVWVPLGVFLIASTQASCVTGSSSGHAALTTGFVFSLLLPLIAIFSIDRYTDQVFDFQPLM